MDGVKPSFGAYILAFIKHEAAVSGAFSGRPPVAFEANKMCLNFFAARAGGIHPAGLTRAKTLDFEGLPDMAARQRTDN